MLLDLPCSIRKELSFVEMMVVVVAVDVEQLKLELVEVVVVGDEIVVVIASFYEQHPVFCSEQPRYEPPEGGGELVLASKNKI